MTADSLPAAVLRLRPRQLPSFRLTLTAVASTSVVSVPSTPVSTAPSPISAAVSPLSRRHLSPVAGIVYIYMTIQGCTMAAVTFGACC